MLGIYPRMFPWPFSVKGRQRLMKVGKPTVESVPRKDSGWRRNERKLYEPGERKESFSSDFCEMFFDIKVSTLFFDNKNRLKQNRQ